MPPIVPAGSVVFGIQLPVQAQSKYFVEPWELSAGPAEVAAVAQAADRAGFFYVAVCDHVAIPDDLAPRMSAVWWDTIATLGWLAGLTTKTRLMSSVFNLTYRHPLVAAKSFATLDYISQGRALISQHPSSLLSQRAQSSVCSSSAGAARLAKMLMCVCFRGRTAEPPDGQALRTVRRMVAEVVPFLPLLL